MKLIDLLVQELPNRGGWPKGAVECQRFVDEATIDFYDENGNWDDDCSLTYGSIAVELVRKQAYPCESEQVTRDQYEAALAAGDGWIEWGGGECPVGDCELVVAKLRDGTVLTPLSASHLAWWSNEPGFCNGRDIIAYRLHKPDPNSRANDDRL